MIEALVVGTLASVAGLFLGLALAKGLFALFDAVGFTLPNSGILLETRTIVVALLAGDRRHAAREPATGAARDARAADRGRARRATLPESRLARYRTAGSGLVTALGFVALVFGLFAPNLGTTQILLWLGLGALLVFFGVALLSVRVVPLLATVIGWPAVRIGGAPGWLARDNSQRNPQRTASTASALMIGLALVTLVAVLAAGITSSFRGAVEKLWKNADYAITAQNNFSPIPTTVADAAAKAPGVEAVGNVRTGQARAFGKTFFATAVNPATSTMFKIDWKEGSPAVLASLGADGAFVDKGYAKTHKLSLGSPVELTSRMASTGGSSSRASSIHRPAARRSGR